MHLIPALRWTFRAVAVVVGLLVLVLVCGLLWLNSPPGKRFVLAELQKELPGLEVGALEGPLPFTVRIRDLRLADRYGTPVAEVEAIRVRLDSLPLLRRRVVIHEALLVGPRLVVQPTRGGELNLTAITAEPAAPEPEELEAEPQRPPLGVELSSLAIRDGELEVRAPGAEPVRLTGFEVLARASLGRDGAASLDLSRLSGVVARGAERLALEGAAQAKLGAAEGAPGESPVWARARLTARDALRGALTRFTASADGTRAAARLDARLQLPAGEVLAWAVKRAGAYRAHVMAAGVDPASLGLGLPAGELSGGARLAGEGTELEGVGLVTASLRPTAALPSGARGRARLELGGDLRQMVVARLEAELQRLRSGSLSLAGARLVTSVQRAGDGTIRLELEGEGRELAMGETRIERLTARGGLGDAGSELVVAAKRIWSPGLASGTRGGAEARLTSDTRGSRLTLTAALRRTEVLRLVWRTPLGLNQLVETPPAEVPWTAEASLPPLSLALVTEDARGTLWGRLSAAGTLGELTATLSAHLEEGVVAGVPLEPLAVRVETRLGAAGLRLDGRLLAKDQALARLEAQSRWHPLSAPSRRGLSATLAVPGFSLSQVTERAAGWVSARAKVRLEGARREAELEAQVGGAAVPGILLGDLDVDGVLDGEHGELSLAFEQPNGGGLSLEAALDGQALVGSATIDRLDPRRYQPLVPALVGLAGPVSARVGVSAELQPRQAAAPVVRANVEVADAELAVLLSREVPDIEPPEPEELPRADEGLAGLPPFLLERLQIRDSRVHLVEGSESSLPTLTITNVELALENVASRRELLGPRPSVLSMRGLVEGRGELVVFSTADPLAEQPTLAGQARLSHLPLSSLSELLAAKAGVHAPRGWLDLFVEFRVQNGRIDGGIEPVLSDVDVEAAGPALLGNLKALLANVTLDVFSDEARDATATVVPIKGKLESPDVQLVPTTLGLLRNAFVVGLAAGFSRLPPVTAEERQGLIDQAMTALRRQKGPPKAQPVEEEG